MNQNRKTLIAVLVTAAVTSTTTMVITGGTSAIAQNYYPPAQNYRQPPSPHYQPYMVDALQAMNHARGMLESSSHDKGGHRVRAINFLQQAINETNAGIQYANNN